MFLVAKNCRTEVIVGVIFALMSAVHVIVHFGVIKVSVQKSSTHYTV